MSTGGDLAQRVSAALSRANLADKRLALGLSGGLDSMALLDVLARLRQQHPFRLSAIHVNHRISPHAGNWARLCVARCSAYGVPCAVAEVEVVRTGGEGLEAAARTARYAVFMQHDVDAIVLAHHLDDQAETLLLQLLRGAGARGLSAMPEVRALSRDSSVALLRPLLDVPRSELAAYAQQRRLQWVDDETNADLDFDRNWLRYEVLPRIATRFPAYRETWLRAARNLADANRLGEALARIDAAAASAGEGLRAAALRELGDTRARNVLRWYLDRNGVRPPARERLDEALRQLLVPRADAQPLIALGAVCLRRHRGVIHLVAHAPALPRGWYAAWRGETQLALPSSLGALRFQTTHGQGLSRARLADGPVSVRLRTGGERMKPAQDRPLRTLKNLLREAGIPAWQRERLPILFCGGTPVWAPGIGCDVRFAAAPGEPGVLVRWLPDPISAGQ